MQLFKLNKEQTLKIVLVVGEIMLKSGAETYRVEDTIIRMCRVQGHTDIQPFVTPTLILIGENSKAGISCLVRINGRSTNLEKVAEINDISYAYSKWSLNFQDTLAHLQKIADKKGYTPSWHRYASGISSATFSIMLGGNIADFVAALIVGFVAMYFYQLIEYLHSSLFVSNMVAGIVVGGLACLANIIYQDCAVDKIIVGAVMPFVPGLAFTNGVRDFLSGDLISGNSRISEALIIAVSIAVGVGTMLKLFMWQGGLSVWPY